MLSLMTKFDNYLHIKFYDYHDLKFVNFGSMTAFLELLKTYCKQFHCLYLRNNHDGVHYMFVSRPGPESLAVLALCLVCFPF